MDGYQNLARWLRAARGARSRREVAEGTGLGENTITRYESGSHFRSVPRKLRHLASYYRWTPDSIDLCLQGGEPEVIPEVPPVPEMTREDRAELIQVVYLSDLPPHRKQALLSALLGDLAPPPADDPRDWDRNPLPSPTPARDTRPRRAPTVKPA